ncbi:hypothetical protein GHT07_20950 [Caenimonas koreensis DSM 17982]|uniref:Uncharacterized protein n=1 Tax=Caenimonas koreensis DSM 17982 TaxID=1121255 RepID=A0A844B0F3_9BURK|nr:hypothetical protein [Caenimonas koreensis]MRD49744.1 hypothetical protein [Caenimonas koreensis DSM 17982]
MPGLGGIWFGKQALLACLGLELAQRIRQARGRVSNVECANAVEALGCWLGLSARGWSPEARLRGSQKLKRDDPMEFARVRRRSFYVSQPMRMATTLALPALGLAEGTQLRFNAYTLTDAGRDFIQAACNGYRPGKRDLLDYLQRWTEGREDVDSGSLSRALSPCEPLPREGQAQLRDRLQFGAAGEAAESRQRRRAALAWVERMRQQPARADWQAAPEGILPEHWLDMKAGAALFAARDAALALLDLLELSVATAGRETWRIGNVSPAANAAIEQLRDRSRGFLELKHGDPDAELFCRSCAQASDAAVIAFLVDRDGRVLRRRGDEIYPGFAFRRRTEAADPTPAAEEPDAQAGPTPEAGSALQWPAQISHRIHNIFLLNVDLHGQLSDWLARGANTEAPA